MSFDTEWHYVGESGEIPFENSCQNYTSMYRPVRYMRGADGIVRIEGAFTLGGQVYFTLPEGYRSDVRRVYNVYAWTGGQIIIIDTNGQVRSPIINPPWICLDINYFVGPVTGLDGEDGEQGETGETGPGFDIWNSNTAPYGNNAITAHEGMGYLSQQPNNSVEPGTDETWWKPSFLPSEFDSENLVTEDGKLIIGE